MKKRMDINFARVKRATIRSRGVEVEGKSDGAGSYPQTGEQARQHWTAQLVFERSAYCQPFGISNTHLGYLEQADYGRKTPLRKNRRQSLTTLNTGVAK